MLRKFLVPALATTLVLSACENDALAPSDAEVADDYALMLFGESGSALEGTMGPQPGRRPFDGRSCCRPFPDSIALTVEQREAILALRIAFRDEHADELAALKTIMLEARRARFAGATREEVRAILEEAKPIVEAIRDDVHALHEAIKAIFTEEQLAWLEEHCHRRPALWPRPDPTP